MKSRFLSRWLPAIPISFVLGVSIFSHSCANTTTPPSGGPKDTIPPVIVKLDPLPGAVNVKRDSKIKITFDEYVKVKEQKNIFLSPPMSKAPKYKMKEKSVVVYFEEQLDSGKTYVLDLTNAIVDNNEGNPYAGYTLVFSTGGIIDTMMVTGTVQDCNTLKPLPSATVMLYKDHSDSAIFKHRPDAAVKTDDWGFFTIRNIQDTSYRMYAIIDNNNNNIYDPDNDLIAFIDTLIRPVVVVNDTLPEIMKYDMKDTALCLARKSEYELNVFREKPSKQFIKNKERVDERSAYITFMAPDAQVDSIWIKKVSPKKIITQFNPERDSLEIWVNESKKIPDTLYVNVKYMKTDSLGQLVSTVEQLKLAGQKSSKAAKSTKKDIKKEDTTTVFSVKADGETIEQYGFRIEFKYPLVESAFDSLVLKYKTPKQEEGTGAYTIEPDSTNIRRFTIRPQQKLLPGYEYVLKIPARRFKDITGYYNDSLDVKVSLPNDDKLSTLTLNLKNVHSSYIVELLNDKRTETLRDYVINSECSLAFPYIKAGQYSIRITEDRNGNGLVDTGNLLGRRQPEKVKFFKLADGKFIIEIPEMTEMSQDIDLVEMFR